MVALSTHIPNEARSFLQPNKQSYQSVLQIGLKYGQAYCLAVCNVKK